MDFEEARRHAGRLDDFPEVILEGIRAELPGYLWIDDHYENGWFDGYYELDPKEVARRFHCDVCGGDWAESRRGGRWKVSYKQGEVCGCPQCGAKVTVKHLSRGFSTLRDVVDVVFYGKSWINPHAVVVYAAHCERDYGLADDREPWTLDTDVDIRGIAVAIYGRGAWKFNRRVAAWETYGKTCVPQAYEWRESKSLGAMAFQSSFYAGQIRRCVLVDSLYEAIEDTEFARAWDDDYLRLYDGQDGLWALAMIAKYPCIEYLTKHRWTDFLERYLNGTLPPRLLNWNGKDMASVLRLSKSRLGELKGQKLGVSPELVAVLQWADKNGVRMGAKLAASLANACSHDGKGIIPKLERTLALLPAGQRDRGIKYLAKQGRRSDVEDYWRAEAELGGDLSDGAVAFPVRFREAHDRAVRRAKYKDNPIYDEKIKERFGKLNKAYGFAFGGLVLRPATSCAEVIREGEALDHCVGTYVGKYANGDTNIFVLRRAVEPDVPWRTVEIARDGHVVQDRGFHNDWGSMSLMTDQYRAALDVFWAAWRERRTA